MERQILVPLDGSPFAETILPHAERAELASHVEETAGDLRRTGIAVRTRLLAGDPAAQIRAVAAAEDADLIVMATHGRAGLKRMWLGSVALAVSRETTRPALLVRAAAARELGR